MDDAYDLIVIGSGPGGEKGAAQAAYFGKRVLVVEKQPVPGGACVNTGTLPSKTLRETAVYMSGFAQRQLYGVHAHLTDEPVSVNDLMCRKEPVIAAEVGRIERNFARHGIDYIQGKACFEDARTVMITRPDGGHLRASADVILVAVGSRPMRPPEFPWHHGDCEDSDTILELDRMPSSMIVVGAGVIGVEYAAMFQHLGVDVTLLDRGERLLPWLDVEVSQRLSQFFRDMGMDVRHEARVATCDALEPTGVVVKLESGEVINADKLLFAAGRVGNVDSLDLASAGLEANERGHLTVDAHYETSVPGIYAVGDCVGWPALASVSMEQGRVAMCHAFDLKYKDRVSELMPTGIYSIPEVSAVGETEETAREKGINVVAGRAYYNENTRGQIIGDVKGMVKVLVCADDRRIIGCHVIGDRATELIHYGLAHMHHDGTVDDLIDMVFNYPSLGESFKYAAYDALGQLNTRIAVP